MMWLKTSNSGSDHIIRFKSCRSQDAEARFAYANVDGRRLQSTQTERGREKKKKTKNIQKR